MSLATLFGSWSGCSCHCFCHALYLREGFGSPESKEDPGLDWRKKKDDPMILPSPAFRGRAQLSTESVRVRQAGRDPLNLSCGEKPMSWPELIRIMIELAFENIPQWGLCGRPKRWELDSPLLRGDGAILSFSNVNPLSSEEPRVHRPNSGAKHCQCRSESGQCDAIAYFASSRCYAP